MHGRGIDLLTDVCLSPLLRLSSCTLYISYLKYDTIQLVVMVTGYSPGGCCCILVLKWYFGETFIDWGMLDTVLSVGCIPLCVIFHLRGARCPSQLPIYLKYEHHRFCAPASPVTLRLGTEEHIRCTYASRSNLTISHSIGATGTRVRASYPLCFFILYFFFLFLFHIILVFHLLLQTPPTGPLCYFSPKNSNFCPCPVLQFK